VKVGLVTTTDVSVLVDDVDRPAVDAAFAARGIGVDRAAWDDPSVDWAGYDLVVVRSPWDYPERLEAFLRWLEDVGNLPTFHNPGPLIRWNLDKRYLDDLAMRGVPIVPTRFASDATGLADALLAGAQGAPELVVKPSISAGSRLTGRFTSGSAAAADLGGRILDLGLTAMVQPFASSVDTRGEHSAVMFDGELSHTFRKGPILGDEGRLRGDTYIEEVSPVALSRTEHRVVAEASAASTQVAFERGWLRSGEQMLYGRFDLVTLDDGTVALLEAELFEPCFFLPVDPLSADRFVDAVVRRITSG